MTGVNDRRRTLLAGVSVAVLGGCLDLLDEEESDDVESVSESVVASLEGDAFDEAIVHSNATRTITAADLEHLEDYEFDEDSITVLERGDDRAVVAVEYVETSDDGTTREGETELEFRREDGDWRLYDIQPIGAIG